MFIEQQIFATLLQPNEPNSFLANWVWELTVNTPGADYPIRRYVMQGVLVPNMHFEVCLRRWVIRPYPFLPTTYQFINQRLHVHAHFIP
jgi:hypothetical protein